jgi:tetratricopeptide (TPR) repeat protein
MQLVCKTKFSRLALSLSLSVVSAACLTSVMTTNPQGALAQETTSAPGGAKASQGAGGQTSSAGGQTSSAGGQTSSAGGQQSSAGGAKAGQSAKTTMTIAVPVKDAGNSEADFEARLHAEAVARAARQNEALQHYDASRVYLASGNTELADLELQAAIMDAPDIRAFHRDFCLVSILRGHPMRAVAEAMMVVGLGDPIPLSDKQVEKLRSQGCKLHYRRALELARAKNWKDAITEFQWALEYRPNTASVMRSMAFANASLGNIELAEKQYGTSFAADPADAYGHADLAFLLAETGKGTEAIKQLQEAVKLQPKVAALHIDLGWMAESKGNLGEAEGEFAQAVQLSPKHASLWTHLGKLLARQGKAEEAAEAYKNALALDPSAEDALHGLESLKRTPPKAGGSTVTPSPEAGKDGRNQRSEQGGGGTNLMPPKFINREA